MKILLKLVTFLSLWTLVGIIIVYVDPLLIKDTIVPGLYLPILIPLWLAIVYTTTWIIGIGWVAVAAGSVVTSIIVMLLVL